MTNELWPPIRFQKNYKYESCHAIDREIEYLAFVGLSQLKEVN